MFINSKKSFEIREGEKVCIIPKDFIGDIPAWAAGHWMVKSAIADGSIASPKGAADKALRKADKEAKKKADDVDTRTGVDGEPGADQPPEGERTNETDGDGKDE